MLLLLAFAFLAGIITVLSPCILPLLPVVLAGGVGKGKRRPLGVLTGFVGGFSLLTLTLSTIVRATGLDPDVLRWISAALIMASVITLANALGTAISLFLIMIGGRTLLQKVPRLVSRSSSIQRGFRVIMMATAVALFTGADRAFSTWMLKIFSSYGSGLTAIEDRPEVLSELELRGSGAAQSEETLS